MLITASTNERLRSYPTDPSSGDSPKGVFRYIFPPPLIIEGSNNNGRTVHMVKSPIKRRAPQQRSEVLRDHSQWPVNESWLHETGEEAIQADKGRRSAITPARSCVAGSIHDQCPKIQLLFICQFIHGRYDPRPRLRRICYVTRPVGIPQIQWQMTLPSPPRLSKVEFGAMQVCCNLCLSSGPPPKSKTGGSAVVAE